MRGDLVTGEKWMTRYFLMAEKKEGVTGVTPLIFWWS